MKNLKLVKVALLMSTSIVLVGCQNGNNTYENKTIMKVETTNEYSELASLEETTTKIEETTMTELTTCETETTKEIETNTEAPSTTQQQTTIQQQTTTQTELEKEMTDEEVINYIRSVSDKMTGCSENITDSVKKGFITVVDFLFYDGTIGGRTFDSLKDDAKSTVLGIYDTISSYLEEKWPVWKEYLGEKYEDLKVLWNDKKDDLSDLWQSGKQKIKNRYEKFRDENGD